MRFSKSYSLAKHCQSITSDDEYSKKLMLHINVTGAVVRSHEDYLSQSTDRGPYPDNLSCELVAEVAQGSKVMLLIESLHIPTDTPLCDENYLYVFDYDSSRSKAMAAAGGEKGLCGHTYPRFPIITTGPFITIVFNSKVKTQKVPGDAGFLLTLTEVVPDNSNHCQSDRYRCGPMQLEQVHNQLRRRYRREEFTPRVTVAKHTIPKATKASFLNYCIPLSLVCDGVRNCHDYSDEDSKKRKFCEDFQKTGVINKFLSLGLSASIAIAVSCIIATTLCVGLTACYCIKWCTSDRRARPPQAAKDTNTRPIVYQGMVIVPSAHGVNIDNYYTSNLMAAPSGLIPARADNSSASSFEVDKMYCLYQDNQRLGYLNIGRPASEKMCQWATSSLLSYPSNSEGHHSHPETPYFKRDPSKVSHSPRHTDHLYRPYHNNNSRCHHNSYSHQTPTSSRSAKSTRSTMSSNVDRKNGPSSEPNPRDLARKYPMVMEDGNMRMIGPVLGQL